MADEIRITVRASQLEVPVVGRQPGVEHLGDGDATVANRQRTWRLLAAMAGVALDTEGEERSFTHPTAQDLPSIVAHRFLRSCSKLSPMAKTPVASVDRYIASQPKGAQLALRRVRAAIRKALPKAEEAISYGIAAFKVDGRVVIYFAGWKHHYSIYPATAKLVEAFKNDLAPYEVNDKGTIRFPLSARVPVTLIQRIAKFRAKEVAERAKAKAAEKR